MHAPCSRLARAVDEDNGCSSDGADDADEPTEAKLSAKAAQELLERNECILAQLRPGSWGPSAKAAAFAPETAEGFWRKHLGDNRINMSSAHM